MNWAVLIVIPSQATTFGRDNIETLESLHSLALLFCEQRKYFEALDVASKFMGMRKGLLGRYYKDLVGWLSIEG